MPLPGPGGPLWAVALLLGAGSVAVLGELLRAVAARAIGTWRDVGPIERVVLDVYLGGGLLYLLAAVRLGLFTAPLVAALPIAAALLLLFDAGRRRRRGDPGEGAVRALASLRRPIPLLVIGSALALYVIERGVALPIGTGNTFDASLLTTYTALLLQHGSIPLSFAPYATSSILYPQGTTVWLGWAELTFGLPPARTSLLVTPLFFALAPLSAFALGRRLVGSERAGLAFALTLAWLAPWTRDLVGGSNDFVFAFPLVLLLAGFAAPWFRGTVPKLGEAVGLGLLVGYSAALNPVGAEWLLPAVFLAGLWTGLSGTARGGPWLRAWVAAAAASLLGVVPSLYVLVLGRSSPGFVPGAAAAPAGSPTGITGSQFLGSIDPFLFRARDFQLSLLPPVRLELALLLALGLALLVLVRRESALGRYLGPFRRFAAIGSGVLVALLGLLWLAATGFGPAVVLSAITSAGEISAWLFTVYVLVAALPLVIALERAAAAPRPEPIGADRPARRSWTPPSDRLCASDPTRRIVPLAIALLILAPGVALTPTMLPPALAGLYHDFGNVTASDLELLEYAGAHLPPGARVLVAPGSAALFLPGYATNIVLLYPLVPGFPYVNASYTVVVNELSNGTLDAAGRVALAVLAVNYIVVTGNSTLLWPAFSATPLLNDPASFPLVVRFGDAFLFERVGG